MSFAYLLAPLQCPHCSTLNEPAEIRTQIYGLDAGQVLRIGDPLKVTAESLASTHHAIRMPAPSEPVSILDEWMCSSCGLQNWAEVVVRDNVLEVIAAVQLDRITLSRAHFIDDGIAETFEDATGESIYDGDTLRADWIPTLLERAS
jgi:hypothetical protein